MDRNGPVLSSNLFLDRVGEVIATHNTDGLSWKTIAPADQKEDSFVSSCLDKFCPETESEIKFSDVYAVELSSWGPIHKLTRNASQFLSATNTKMHRFVVHTYSRRHHTSWVLAEYAFGHEDLNTCETWVETLNLYIQMQVGRPKNLLVFVHPLCGKGHGRKNWETVAPIFSRSKVKTKVHVTQRAGHAFDIVTTTPDRELGAFDGIVAVGGDGLFNEILNGLLLSRHKAPYPPTPSGFNYPGNNNHEQQHKSNDNNGRASFNNTSGSVFKTTIENEDHEPLLSPSEPNFRDVSCFNQDHVLSFPNDQFRLGIIPSGSTDAIVISTTGMRDPITSALQIILGKKMALDIAHVVRWKTQPSSMDLPFVRYAASFAGYGFYGDVIRESEKYRWMGPARYDFAGTKVFLKHRSYEAEVAFLEDKTVARVTGLGSRTQPVQLAQENIGKMICRTNCNVCNKTQSSGSLPANGAITRSDIDSEDLRWLRLKGRFLSIGAAVISCRNERAPDGLVADAHLADGFLHLILIKDCPRPFYLWHLTQLTRKGSNPLDFEFVEHHKTPAFTFISTQDESVWNLDGEMLQACQLSVQVCRGLVNLFASGPET